MPRISPLTAPSSDAVLTKAILRAKDYWELSNKQLGDIIGISEASVSRMATQGRLIDPSSKEGQLGVLFVRAFRSLDATMGGHVENEKAWLNAHNHILNGIPVQLIEQVDGLYRTVQYLDAIRGHG